VRKVQPYLIGLLFIAAGALHFVVPKWYEAIVPPYLPSPKALVAMSGIFEVLGGLGVVVPATRRFSGWGLVALLLAVFPANLYMATDSERFRSLAPAWSLYARLPLQFLLIWWIYRACIASED
jgi:uncharacterized membrane protein